MKGKEVVTMKYTYPVLFFVDDDCVGVQCYDIDNCFTFGRTFAEAIDNAEDALNLMLWHLEEEKREDEIPAPTAWKDIVLKDHQSVMLIHADTEAYAAKMATMNFDDENFYDDYDYDVEELKKG